MFGILKRKLFGSNGLSKSSAKSRLHFVLVQDRTGLDNEELAEFKRELIGVIEKYFVIDERGFDIAYERASDLTSLVINSPILVRKHGATKLRKAEGEKKGTDKKERTPATANV